MYIKQHFPRYNLALVWGADYGHGIKCRLETVPLKFQSMEVVAFSSQELPVPLSQWGLGMNKRSLWRQDLMAKFLDYDFYGFNAGFLPENIH